MANYIYGAVSLTGGGTGSLDSLDGSELFQADAAIVFTSTATYIYTLDESYGGSENIPEIIVPDQNPGNKRWKLVSSRAAESSCDVALFNGILNSSHDDVQKALSAIDDMFNSADFTIAPGSVELSPTVVKLIGSNSGAATPVDHIFRVTGDGKLRTTASGNTVTVHSDDLKIVTKYINYTITKDDDIVVGDCSGGSIELTLPQASTKSAISIFKLSNSHSLTIRCYGSETIEGATSYVINDEYGTLRLISNGVNTWITSAQMYDLPIASDTVVGAIKIGDNLSMNSGTLSPDFSSINTDLVPDVDVTRSLGSPTKAWKDVYVGPGSLYVNGQKVLEEAGGTIVLSADEDQNIQIKTGGGGDIEFYPSGAGSIEMKGTLSIQGGKNIVSSDGNPISFANHIQMNGLRITGIGEPVNPGDVVTKSFATNASNLVGTLPAGTLPDNYLKIDSNLSDLANIVTAKTNLGLNNVANVDTTNASNITTGTLSSSVLPPIAITTTQVAVNQTAMLALTTQQGDVVVRTDLSRSYIHNGGSAGTMADFTELSTPVDSVLSVNTKTGTIVLSQDDVGDGTTYKRSTAAFTTALNTKLNSIATGAQVNPTAAAIKTSYESNANTNAFTDTLLTKVNSVESGATADQTASEIKTAYESNANTNAFTDTLQTKLNGIDTSLYATKSNNLSDLTSASSARTNLGLGNVANVDTTNASNITTGTLPSSVLPPIAITTTQVASSEVAMLALTTQEGDVVVRTDLNRSFIRGSGLTGTISDFIELATPGDAVTSVNTKTGTVVLTQDDVANGTTYKRSTASYTTALNTKLTGIETAATADQTASEIKGLYESNSDTNAFTNAFKTKIEGIETGATADQTASEIKSLYESNASTNALTDTLLSKLNGIEAGAEVNLTAAEVKSLYESNTSTNAFNDTYKSKLDGLNTDLYTTKANNLSDLGNTATARINLGLGNVQNVDTTNATNITTGTLPSSVLPPIAITKTQVAANQTAMLALTTEEGDIVVRTDESKTYIKGSGTAGTMADFIELATPGDAVTSVNTKTGTVVLTQDNIGDGTTYKRSTAAFTTTLNTKLSGIETGATADQTAAEIKTAYESNSNTNVFNDTSLNKLNGIETGAQVNPTNAAIKTAYESNSNTNAFTDALQTKLNGIDTSLYTTKANNLSDLTNATTARTNLGLGNVPNINCSDASNITTGTLPSSVLPPIAITKTQVATNQAAMLALTTEEGDVVIRTDLSKTYIKGSGIAGTMADFLEIVTPGDVTSVNTQTGTVVLTQDNIGDGTTYKRTHNDFTSTLLTKLNGVEIGATADQTAAEIKTLYESNASTNVFSDALLSKLNGIETAATADQTDAEIKAAYERNSNTNVFTDTLQTKLNGIDTSLYATKANNLSDLSNATTARTNLGLGNVANVDCTNASNITTGTLPSSVLPPIAITKTQVAASQVAMLALTTEEGDVVVRTDESKTYIKGSGTAGTMADFIEIMTPGDVTSVNSQTGTVILTQDNVADGTTYKRSTASYTTALNTKLNGIAAGAQVNPTAAAIKTSYESNANTNAFTDTYKSKVDGIEVNATADQTAAEIKTAYESNANTNVFNDTYKSKVDGIEANATADQTATEILTAIKTVDGTGSGLDADLLDGYSASTSASPDTIALRNVNGDLAAVNIYSSVLRTSYGTVARTADTIFYSSVDDVIRKTDGTSFKTSLGLEQVTNLPAATGNSGNTVVQRDSNGDFSSRNITVSNISATSTYTAAGEGLEIKSGGDRTSSPTLGNHTPNDTRLINLKDGNPGFDGALIFTGDLATTSDAGTELLYMDRDYLEWKGNTIYHAGNSHNHLWANITDAPSTFEPTPLSVKTLVGQMVTGNTETGLSVTYQSTDNTLDFVLTADPVITLAGDLTGSATMTNLGSTTLTATVVDDSHNHTFATLPTIDEDTMVSDSAVLLPSQQSVKAYVDTKVANVVNSAPAALDTLNELAAALGDDPNFATTLTTSLGTKADNTITITAGSGLTGGGTLAANRTISHADTSAQASVNNSGRTYIQDITLDTYGHITAISSATETVEDTNTWRGIDDVPVDGSTAVSISSNWAYDHAADTNPHGATYLATPSTIVARNTGGDTYVRYLYSDFVSLSGGQGRRDGDTIFYSSYDGFIRKNTDVGFKNALGLGNVSNVAAATTNTSSTIVQRDASGNFSAGTISAELSGNSTTATTATTATNVTVSTTTDSLSYVGLWENATGNQGAKTDGGLTYNASSNALTCSGTIYGGTVAAGYGSGSVALNVNDGQGNANITFNHDMGVPDSTGNSARIVVNTDSTSGASVSFELASGVTNGVYVDTLPKFTIGENSIWANGTITSTGSMAAPSFIGSLTGNANTATKLSTARTINGVSFDGSSNITIDAGSAYVHPTQTAINVNLADDGISVIDNISVNTEGHVTDIGTRYLSPATPWSAGVMSTADKAKLDGMVGSSWNVISSNTNAQKGQGYSVDTSAGEVTITLPSSVTAGDKIEIIDYSGTFGINKCIIARSYQKIMGIEEDFECDISNLSLQLVWIDFEQGWKITTITYGGETSNNYFRRNAIINGNFDIWQRGTSQTSNGYGSDDRWSNWNFGSTKVASRGDFYPGETFGIPNNPPFFSRTVVTSVAGAGNYVIKAQKIENVRTFSGKTVTLSFWAKANSNKNMSIGASQYFGSTGSAEVGPLGVNKFALTSSWQKIVHTFSIPSISGKTLSGLNDDCLIIKFYFDAGSNFNNITDSLGQQSGTFDIAQVQLEEGSVATPFEIRLPGEELRLCQRYYEKGLFGWILYTIAGNGVVASQSFKVEKRSNPIMSQNNTTSSNLTTYLISGSTSSFSSGSGVAITTGATINAGAYYADSEL